MRLRLTAAVLAATGALAGAGSAQAADPGPETIYGVAGANLVALTSTNAALTLNVPITGLQAGEAIRGLDFRPATGELYGLSDGRRIYRINSASGAATLVGGPYAVSGNADIDFNPVPDAIRLVSSDRNNLRINPSSGAVLGVDTNLAPAGAFGAAYTNSVAGATSTTLYALDGTNVLRQGGFGGNPSPNGGALTTVGAHGDTVAAGSGFDISPVSGRAFGLASVAGVAHLTVYDLESGTGAQTVALPGVAGLGAVAAAPAPPSVFLSSPLYGAGEASGTVTFAVRRTGDTRGGSSVTWAPASGTATAGADFAPAGGTVTFGPGETVKEVAIPIVNDSVREQPETFTIALSNPTDASVVSPGSATVTIFDDDQPSTPDTTRPVVLVVPSSNSVRLRTALRGVRFSASVSERATTVFELRRGGTRLGRLTRRTTGPAVIRTTLRLSSSGKRALRRSLRRRRSVKLTLRATATDAANLRGSRSASLRVRR